MPEARRWLLVLVCLAAVVTGCEPAGGDALVVATRWPSSDRMRLAAGFSGWLERRPEPSVPHPGRIHWLILAPGDDLVALAARRRPPDVLLGGPARSYERLAIAKRLSPLPIDGSPAWAVSRTSEIRPASTSSELTAFDDPRNDPVSLARFDAQLARGRFRQGYARLIEAYGSASGAIERHETDLTAPDAPDASSIPWIEGVAIVADARHREQAGLFLKFLSETNGAIPIPPRSEPANADDLELLATLLGATLVDARDELWAAWEALNRAGSPATQLRWMTEPPPWPPASIVKILSAQGEQAMAMVETLAGQLAPDPAARAWLISSWLSPPRLIDRDVLAELAGAAEGRLFREPRFSEWLRAEWTAWARQRYRRVQRIVEAGRAQTSPTTSSIDPH